MDSYNFHTHVRISRFTPEEILEYKKIRGETAFPRQNRIKVFLPDWFVKEVKAQVDTSGKIRFSEINNSFKKCADLILELAKGSSLADRHLCKLEDNASAKLLVALKKDKTHSSFTPVLEIHETPNKKDNVIKFLNFIVYTILEIKSESLKKEIFENLIDYSNEEEKNSQIKNCINHLFFWISNHASRNLHKEITQNLNAKTHFIREYGNWFTREVLKAKYMFIEYKSPFEAIICPIDYSTRKLNDAIFEIKERKKVGTITYSDYEIFTYYKMQERGDFIKGAIIRVYDFIKSDFPVCFVFKMRVLDYDTVMQELKQIEDQDSIHYPKKYLDYINK